MFTDTIDSNYAYQGRGVAAISNETTHSEHPPTTVISTADPEPQITPIPPVQVEEEDFLDDEVDTQDQHIGIGMFRFRFSLSSFRLGRAISERRFSIAEAAVLLMVAYIA